MDLLKTIEDKADEISTKLYGMSFHDLDNDRQDHIYLLASLDVTEILGRLG